MTLHLLLDPIDTVLFRDGRPFNQQDEGASVAVSVFPPYPPTIVGAVRAALWGGRGDWPKNELGDGTNWQVDEIGKRLDPLCFSSPLLVRQTGTIRENGQDKPIFEPVFPMPAHILWNDRNKTAFMRLEPGTSLRCDWGDVSLPTAPPGARAVKDQWITAEGMKTILGGGVPNTIKHLEDCKGHLIARQDLWRIEPRVGVGIDQKTRTTANAQLYMASHIRLQPDVQIYVTLDGYNGSTVDALRPLAGEHRMAWLHNAEEPVALPDVPDILPGERYCVIQLSPLVLDAIPKAKKTFCGLPGTLVSACLGKPIPIGGWDSQAKRPLPLRLAIPAGSVWFFEGGNGTPRNMHKVCIGVGAKWGFGQVLIGRW